jgi:hypothetical protein
MRADAGVLPTPRTECGLNALLGFIPAGLNWKANFAEAHAKKITLSQELATRD